MRFKGAETARNNNVDNKITLKLFVATWSAHFCIEACGSGNSFVWKIIHSPFHWFRSILTKILTFIIVFLLSMTSFASSSFIVMSGSCIHTYTHTHTLAYTEKTNEQHFQPATQIINKFPLLLISICFPIFSGIRASALRMAYVFVCVCAWGDAFDDMTFYWISFHYNK